MNRRTFFAGLLALPPAVKAAIAGPAPYTVEQLMNCPPNPDWARQAKLYPYYDGDIGVVCDRKTEQSIRKVFGRYYAEKYGVT
jgi:hypothetical protein